MSGDDVLKTLDLGCGRAKTPGAVGVDRFIETDADVVADIDAPHLPFKDGVFDRIEMTDSLEHTADVRATLIEAARVLKTGGTLTARVPHFSSLHAYSDFTHKNFFSAEGLGRLLVDDPDYGHYTIGAFEIEFVRITLWKAWRLLGIEWFANRFTQVYEKLFAFRFPAMYMEFRLTRLPKPGN